MRETRHNLPVPLNFPQQPMLIEHSVDGAVIPQRPRDGYINATLLCKHVGKQFGHYREAARTQAFLEELSVDIGIPISTLLQSIKGGNRLQQGTWVHPQVSVNLGMWLSPAFAVQVTKWVIDWAQGKTNPYMPVHVQRFLKNRNKIPHTHFSMLNEIYLNLFAPLEEQGVIPPDKIMPDISTGRMFSDFLRSKGIEPTLFDTYEHEFADDSRMPVKARLYPIEHLPDFRRYFNETWLPERAETYFAERFPKALPYLPRISELPAAEPRNNQKKPRGRPPEIVWPEPIDASPEDIARAVLQVPHKKKWRFMKEAKAHPEQQLEEGTSSQADESLSLQGGS